jgi:hypothetical protein
MAVGFPVKDDYATGDVLTAANMNDLAGTLNTVPTFAGNVNPVINAAMQVAQRGTTFSAVSGFNYTLDRWQGFRGAGAQYSISQQATSDTTNLPFIASCARVGRPSGNVSTQIVYFAQSFESLNSRAYAGKVVTLSFYARKGADYSSTSSVLNVELVTGTGTDQNIINGFTGAANPINQTATLTTTWQRFTYVSSTLSSSLTQLGMYFYNTPVGTAGAADFFEVTGVQIDIGSVALPFRTNGATFQGELAACMRYYQKSLPQGTAPAANAGRTGAVENYAIRAAAAIGISTVRLPVIMRGTPTVIIYNPSAAGNEARNIDTGTDCTSTTVEAQADSSFRYYYTLPASTVSTNLISANYEASAEL